MNIRRIGAVARKEIIHVVRDWRSMSMAISIPLFQLILFGWALTLDVDRVPLAIWDQSNTPESREFVAEFASSRYFSVREAPSHYDRIERAIDERAAVLAMVVPEDFARRIGAGQPCDVQILADGSDSNTATIALGYAEMAAYNYSQRVMIKAARRVGAKPISVPVSVDTRVWFNEEMESKNNIVPGIIAVIMSMIAALLTSLTIAREWERGTMEQLASTPVRGAELVLGKLVPYFGLGMVNMVLAVLLGKFAFAVPLRGSVTLLFFAAALFLFVALAQGILISIVTRNQLLATQGALLTTFLPAFLLSGFAFAISNMPRPLQILTYIVPSRYFVTLMKSIYMKGVGLEVLGREILLLAAFCAVLIFLSILFFKKKLR
jgi:ABC-2 type transport system permease protein